MTYGGEKSEDEMKWQSEKEFSIAPAEVARLGLAVSP
jgi:hypothetical protein